MRPCWARASGFGLRAAADAGYLSKPPVTASQLAAIQRDFCAARGSQRSNRAMHGILAESMQTRATVSVRYPVRTTPAAWVLPEGTVPEAPVHHTVAHRVTLLLEAWASRQGRDLRVLRNLALRWLEEFPRTGIDPDVCLLDPPPPNLDEIASLCLWKPGHVPPSICFEVVSANHPYKDYSVLQDRYAALGTHELIVFDPLLSGPPSLGGPVSLQVWRRDPTFGFERVHFASSPAYSETLDAWLIPDGRTLHLARDRAGMHRFQTEAEYAQMDADRAQVEAKRAQGEAKRAQAEAERAQVEAERAQADAEQERRAREDLARRLSELESKLEGS